MLPRKGLLILLAGLTAAAAGAVGVAGAVTTNVSSDREATADSRQAQAGTDSATSGPEGKAKPQPTSTTAAGARAGDASASGAVAARGTTFKAGDKLTSPNKKYVFVQQSDGNAVVYNSSGVAQWSTQTGGHSGAVSAFQKDGNFVVYAKDGKVLFYSATTGTGMHMGMQDDGNLVIYNGDKKGVWASQAQGHKLYAHQKLFPGQSRTSSDGRYSLHMQSDGNLVIYNANRVPTWSSQTGRHAGAYALFGSDGQLVVHSSGGTALFASAKKGTAKHLVMQNDGNLVAYTTSDNPIWASKLQSSNLYPGQRLRRGQWRTSADGRYSLHMQGDGNLVLTKCAKPRAGTGYPCTAGATQSPIWSSKTGGTSGTYATVNSDGNVVVISSGGKALWASRSSGRPAFLQVQNDGNLVLYDTNKKPLWHTATTGK
ncbi:MAG: hypothetical protein ACRDT6_10650 [Micromonosporaceae bacterium]